MKMTNRILAAILLLTMALCLVACSGGEETKTPTICTTMTAPTTTVPPTTTTAPTTEPVIEYNYRVRVVDNKGEPIEGAIVSFCLEQCSTYETNADGFALIDAETAEGYKARIESLPEGYEDYTFVDVYIFLAPGQTDLFLMASKRA